MILASQQAQLAAGAIAITRLIEPNAIAIEQLIGADNETIRRLPADMVCLKLSQRQRCRLGAVRLY